MKSEHVMASLGGLCVLAAASFQFMHGAKAEGRVQILAIPEAGASFMGGGADATVASRADRLANNPLHHAEDFDPDRKLEKNEEGIWEVRFSDLLLETYEPPAFEWEDDLGWADDPTDAEGPAEDLDLSADIDSEVVEDLSPSGPGDGVVPEPEGNGLPPEPEVAADATDEEGREDDDLFPERVLQLHGERVAIEGYMTPMKYDEESDRIVTFALSRYLPGCCFGMSPGYDEWIEIEVLAEGGVEYMAYGTIVVTGKFEVGEVLDEFGYLSSIYRLEADSIKQPW